MVKDGIEDGENAIGFVGASEDIRREDRREWRLVT